MHRQVRLSRYQLRPWLSLTDVALGTRENAGKNQPMFKPNGGDIFEKSSESFRVLIGVKNRGASPAADVHLQVHWCSKETAPQTIEECKQLESGITPDTNLSLEQRKHGFSTPGEELFTEREFSVSDLETIRRNLESRQQLYAIGAATYKYAECRYRTRFCLRYFSHGLQNESFLIGCDMGEVLGTSQRLTVGMKMWFSIVLPPFEATNVFISGSARVVRVEELIEVEQQGVGAVIEGYKFCQASMLTSI